MQIDLTQPSKQPPEDTGIKNTKCIIAALKKMVREHNSESEFKVTFNQLKSLFIDGTKDNGNENSTLCCGFARANMFCRLLKLNNFAHEFRVASPKVSKAGLIDFSNYIVPSKQDFDKSSNDIKRFNLDFTIATIDELYLAEYDSIPSYEEYL